MHPELRPWLLRLWLLRLLRRRLRLLQLLRLPRLLWLLQLLLKKRKLGCGCSFEGTRRQQRKPQSAERKTKCR